MNRLLARLHVRMDRNTLAATTFCESCSEVCTPACRQDARLDQYRQTAYHNGLFRI
jgi:hypothetical protein